MEYYDSFSPIGSSFMLFASNVSRIFPTSFKAVGVSPWTHNVWASMGIEVPSTAMTTPSFAIRNAR
jgi:hypothetical protein